METNSSYYVCIISLKKVKYEMKIDKDVSNEIKWLQRCISDLYEQKIAYKYSDAKTIAEIKAIFQRIEKDFFKYHKEKAKVFSDEDSAYNMAKHCFGVYNEVESVIENYKVLIMEKRKNWNCSQALWHGKPLIPYMLDIGFKCNHKDFILSFLHEVGHILTHEFVNETKNELHSFKYKCKKFIDEIVAWKKVIELIQALKLHIDARYTQNHMDECLMSYFETLFPDSPKELGSYLISFYIDGDLIKINSKMDSIDTMKSQSCPKSKRDII